MAKDILGVLGLDEVIILERILEKWDVKCRLDSSTSGERLNMAFVNTARELFSTWEYLKVSSWNLFQGFSVCLRSSQATIIYAE